MNNLEPVDLFIFVDTRYRKLVYKQVLYLVLTFTLKWIQRITNRSQVSFMHAESYITKIDDHINFIYA